MDENSGHLDPTSEISLDSVKKRAVSGVAVLTGRTLILNVVSFVAQGLLVLFIEPGEFGVFLLVSATINFLSYFADIGLGAALIQKKEKPESSDYKTVFAVQEILVVTICLVVFAISPIISKTHSLSPQGLMLLYALNISFFLASLKNIPSIILERKLDFVKFVVPQVLENVIYNVTLVYFAWRGFGITSFTYAVLVRGILGVFAMYVVQPWRPGFALSKSSLKSLLKFGIPYQINNLLATIKDDGMTIVVGGILGSYGLGILGTAQKLVQYPLRFFMDNVTKVTFPAFSRMQDDKADLERSLTRSIFFICALVFPSIIGLIVLFPVLIEVIPKYKKWEPAYIPIILLSANTLIAAATTQLTNLLNSTGKIKTTMKLMVMWTTLTWILVPMLSIKYGVNGASLAYGLVSMSSFIVFYIVKKALNWSIYGSVVTPLIASLCMGLGLFLLKGLINKSSLLVFFVLIIFGSVIYASSLYLLEGKKLIEDVKKIITPFVKK